VKERAIDVIDGPARVGDRLDVSWDQWMGQGAIESFTPAGDVVIRVETDIARNGKFDRTGKMITIRPSVLQRLQAKSDQR
jgi:hypothetical protein